MSTCTILDELQRVKLSQSHTWRCVVCIYPLIPEGLFHIGNSVLSLATFPPRIAATSASTPVLDKLNSENALRAGLHFPSAVVEYPSLPIQ